MAYFAYMASMVYIPKENTIPGTAAEGRVAQRQMNPTEIEFAVRDLVAKPYEAGEFPFELIGIYNASKVTVSRLKSGQTNAAKQSGDVLWKKHLFFRPAAVGEDVGAIGDALAADPLTAKHKPRFIVVTNGEQVHARDTQRDDTLNVEFAKLDENSDFLLPLAGFERRNATEEHPADIKAAKKLKKLYDAILAANATWSSGHHTHELNLLMTRLLFCFYAEDTGIFDTPQVFTNTVTQHTTEDGSDIAPLLDRLFRIMNIEEAKRPKGTPAVEAKFPYVNGSLFEDTVEIPKFNRTARRQLLECGDLDWTTINPDIFGSMIQTIAQDGTRSDLGMHYTSVPNIMKVLQPLFLDELHEAFEKAKDSVPKLEALLGRLSKIRVFDPACGSGNFLIIAYKEMRKLEMQVFRRIADTAPKNPLRFSGISLHNFFGIDVVDFACETAKLSLWIAEHQMNSIFKEQFGVARPTLPLGKITTIRNGNSLRMEWREVCSPDQAFETYLCGNPPYHGAKYQSANEKEDLAFVFSPITPKYRLLDYIGGWFLKASDYIRENSAKAAFVSTNSICQGEIVPALWPLLFANNVEIAFASTSFKWENNASNNAGVSCVIIGLQSACSSDKHLFNGAHNRRVTHIGPYLVPAASNIVVESETNPISERPIMMRGAAPTDDGHLLFTPHERSALLSAHPEAEPLFRRVYGSQEFLHSIERWTVWITDADLPLAESIPAIAKRLKAVKAYRLLSPKAATKASAVSPHRFQEIRATGDGIFVPHTFSELRRYITVGPITARDVVLAPAFGLYNPPLYILAILSSRLHLLWLETVSGKLENRFRYSNTLIYNTFPLPSLSDEQKRLLSDHSKAILKSRAKHPGKTIAELYDPAKMPANLLAAHEDNDAYLEEYVYGRSFKDDTHRLEHLFKMYATLKTRDDTSLFATAASPIRLRK